MDVDARKEFWKELLAAKSESDVDKLQSKIIYPEKIYRYRSVSVRTLNALAENKLYFSTSNYYDDPFDTFVRINRQIILSAIHAFKTKNVPPDFLALYDYLPKDVDFNKVVNEVMNFPKTIQNEIRKRIWSICFTEGCDNENLWLKYANNHKGFVLAYETNLLKNAKFEISQDFQIIKESTNFSLYPMCYSNEYYDATNYAGFFGVCFLLEKIGWIQLIEQFLSQNSFTWEKERILLIKKLSHHYDDEWRLILSNKYTIGRELNPRIFINPSKIILGLKISDDDKKAVLMAAERAGIKNIEQMTIDDNDEFVAKPICIKNF